MKPACPVHNQQWDAQAQLCVWVNTAWVVKKFGLMSSPGAASLAGNSSAESRKGRSVQGPIIKAYTKQGHGSQSAAHGSRPCYGGIACSGPPKHPTHVGPRPHSSTLTYKKHSVLLSCGLRLQSGSHGCTAKASSMRDVSSGG